MEIKLISGATTFEACINTLKQIDTKDFEFQNLVVVPDSLSMQAENLVFDVLNIKATFNIEIVGISRLASKILRNNNIPFDRASGIEEVFAIYNAVKLNEENFKYFKKCGLDFCTKILQIIKQFKGCKITPKDIKNVGDELLDNKMHDLKIVYESYEKLLQEKMDLSKLLDFFVEKSQNLPNLSKINLFFVNFDSFSSEINEFICKLATKVNKVFIGFAKPISVANAFIYENDIFEKTKRFAKENSVLVQVESPATNLKKEHLAMAKNLFAFDIEEQKSDYFLNYLAKNKTDEIEFVARYIKKEIVAGRKYKDFQIAVSNDSYYKYIKQIFEKFDLAYYCDETQNLTQTVLGRFVLRTLQAAKLNFDKDFGLYLLSNPLTNLENSQELLSEVWFENVKTKQEFLQICPQYELFFKKIESLKNDKTIKDFVFDIEEILELLSARHIEFLKNLEDEKLFKEQSENSQAQEIMLATLEKLTTLGGDNQISLQDFESLLNLAFSSVKVETIPSYVDAIFVGDATNSYFEDRPILFVVGATSALPKARADNGIIDDDDINKLKINFALEPKIQVINRRNRLKIFELLQHGQEKLVVSCPTSEDGQKAQQASFVGDLIKMFGENCINGQMFELFDSAIFDDEEQKSNLKFLLANNEDLPIVFNRLKNENILPKKYYSTINSLIKDEIAQDENPQIINIKNGKKTFSASELESYFSCPFKRFVQYGLKISPKENIEPTKRLFGTFEHALLKKFVENFDDFKSVNLAEIEKFLKQNMLEIAKDVYDEKVILDKHFQKYLFNESKIILKNVAEEQKYSKFKPIFLEKKIFDKFYKDFNLVGFVDRVDKNGNYFRIFDYKTGKTDSIKKELFYGKKLQLFLYAQSVAKSEKLDCAGVYYFDCQTKFSKKDQHTNMLNGITKKSNDIVLLTDDRLCLDGFKSDIIGASLKKSAKKDEFAYKGGNFVDNFDDLFGYAKKISSNAMDEIDLGFVEAKPIKGACMFCPYFSVCRHKDWQGYRLMTKVSDENFKGGRDE